MVLRMLRKNIRAEGQVSVKVGDVQFHILRIGERAIHLGVDAPRDMQISFGDDANPNSPPDACECAAKDDTP